MKTLLWLDDVRNPFVYGKINWIKEFELTSFKEDDNKIIWVKNYDEFVSWIEKNGLPTTIAFDHDLGFDERYCNYLLEYEFPDNEKTGYDCAKWLVEYCMNNNKKLPNWVIQSANNVGKENIKCLLTNFNNVQNLLKCDNIVDAFLVREKI